jgi:uncharacterized protein (TIGR00369 family)
MCLVCGEENPYSLHAQFMNLEDGRLCAKFVTNDVHQSYPGRVHGGIISAILDETIGRAVQVASPDLFGVTIELNVRFRKPVPLGVPLTVIAEITQQKRRLFEGVGKLLLEDGSVAADATARYLQSDVNDISDEWLNDDNWRPEKRDAPEQLVV